MCLPDAVRDRIETSLARRLTAEMCPPGAHIPVILTFPSPEIITLALVEERIRALGGAVVRRMSLTASITAEISSSSLLQILQEFSDVRAALDEGGDLESDRNHG